MLKRICSILLIGALLLSTVCFVSSAADGGEISADLHWELSTLGRLTISGSGKAIPDYSAASGAPWAAQAGKVKELSLPKTLRSIGAYAFSGCAALKQVDLGKITSLGEAAFEGCGLTSVVLPYQLKAVPDSCFKACTGLKSLCLTQADSGGMGVEVKDGVTTIGAKAFELCTALSEVYTLHNGARENNLPETVTSIGSEAFSACESLQTIGFAQNGKSLKSLGAGAFSGCVALRAIAIPTGISKIEKETFMQTALREVLLPINITLVGKDAFAFCDALKKIDVRNNSCSFYGSENTTPDTAVLWIVYAAKNALSYANGYAKPVKVLCTGRIDSHAMKAGDVIEKASALQTGSQEQKCSSCGYTTASTIAMVQTVKLQKTKFYFTGKKIVPTAAQVLMYDTNGKQIPSSNFTVTCQTNGKEVGKHSVKIQFKSTSRYKGSFVRYYNILLKGTYVSTVDSGSGWLRVYWPRQTVGTTGYQVRFCKKKDFSSGVIRKTIWNTSSYCYKRNDLARKTGYYIQVRTFREVGKDQYVFSEWSTPYGRKTK